MKNTSTMVCIREDPKSLLQSTGLRCTRERVCVLDTLMALHTPCTVDEVHGHVAKQVNKVTLYRMLEQFADRGVVERVALHDGVRRYEYQDEHHHHVTCTSCGVRTRVQVDELEMNSKALESANGFTSITTHTLEFFGLCERCAGAR